MESLEAATVAAHDTQAARDTQEATDASALSREAGPRGRNSERGIAPRRLGLISLAMFTLALAVLLPTIGDFGLTWDEPAYRFTQIMSEHWWEKLGSARTSEDLKELVDPEGLLYYWQYGRYGMNFHPPLAGQLNLAAYAVFGYWMKDIPARRMAGVIEFALTITIGFHFLARRYGFWVGALAAGSLLLMPRLYGQAHLADTDTPGLLLWVATTVAFWKGLYEQNARRWRVAVGVLMGLAFVEKMGTVMVLLPLLLWLIVGRLPRAVIKTGARATWIDGILTTGLMLAPLGLAFQQIQILQRQLPPPQITDLFEDRPASDWPGAILAVPLLIWLLRRLLGRLFPRSSVWGTERPALEVLTAILAFAPVVGWLGNPAWWRETLPRLAHYYTLTVGRQGALPDISIMYFGQVYEFALPWHNGWVLMGITVPLAILSAGIIGMIWGLERIGRDRLPLYFLIHFITYPIIRMFPTPAHDGVRLFLPTFFFLAAFAGWGTDWLANAVSRAIRPAHGIARPALASLVLGSAALALIRIHPYELSYYNGLVGGPRGAWERGFELSYWYDAFNPGVIDDLNRKFPQRAQVAFLNRKTETALPVFYEHHNLKALRVDVVLQQIDYNFPYVWLLTQDSKAYAFTRLLFAMGPWYASEPRQLDLARVATVNDPVAVSRACGLFILLDAPERRLHDPPAAPEWARANAPWLGHFWGDDLIKAPPPALNEAFLDWSRTDPAGLLAAAKRIALKQATTDDEQVQRFYASIAPGSNPSWPATRRQLLEQLLKARPQALVEAVQILNAHRDEVVKVMSRHGYIDPNRIGGYLDRDL